MFQKVLESSQKLPWESLILVQLQAFTEAATRGVFWKKMLLKISQNLQEKPVVCEIFKNTLFTEHLWMTASCFFPAIKMGDCQLKTSDEYSLSRNTNLKSTIQVYYSFLGSINFQCMFPLVYTVYCQKQPPEKRCSVKKGALKNFQNFIGK